MNTIEVEKFTRISDSWWDINGPCKPLHKLNPTRLNFITQYSNLKNHTCLDIGCGGGILTESLARLGAKVTALDASSELIEIAVKHAKESDLNIDYINITAEDFGRESENKFDIITCMELLEHLDNPSEFVKHCSSLLNDNGKIFFSTLNRTPKSFLTAIAGAEYVMKILPKGTHDYNKFIKPSELSSWLRKASLDLLKIQGVFYNPITHGTHFSDNIDVNYMVCAQKMV